MTLYPSARLFPSEDLWPSDYTAPLPTQVSATTPHLQWPPLLVRDENGNAVFATVEQDEPVEVTQSYALLCELRPGMLPWAEQLGIPDPLGGVADIVADDIQQALTDQDGRLPVVVDILDDPVTGRRLRLRVTVNPDE